jgi:ABC-type thiamin/hydroxymethylpyrimidine transport system permease subunit
MLVSTEGITIGVWILGSIVVSHAVMTSCHIPVLTLCLTCVARLMFVYAFNVLWFLDGFLAGIMCTDIVFE